MILCVAKLPENLSVTPQETALPGQPSALDSPWDCEGEVGITTSISEARRADPLQMCVVHALLVFLAKASRLCTEEVGTEPEEQLSTFCCKTKLSVLIKVNTFPPTSQGLGLCWYLLWSLARHSPQLSICSKAEPFWVTVKLLILETSDHLVPFIPSLTFLCICNHISPRIPLITHYVHTMYEYYRSLTLKKKLIIYLKCCFKGICIILGQ